MFLSHWIIFNSPDLLITGKMFLLFWFWFSWICHRILTWNWTGGFVWFLFLYFLSDLTTMHSTTEQDRTLICRGASVPTMFKHNEVLKSLFFFLELHWVLFSCKSFVMMWCLFCNKDEPKMLWLVWMSKAGVFLCLWKSLKTARTYKVWTKC